MKKIALLSICLIPSLIFAQEDDYCPCMENSNPLINVMNMMSSMDEIAPQNFDFQRNSTIPNIDFSMKKNSKVKTLAPQQIEQQEEESVVIEKLEKKSEVVLKNKKHTFKLLKKTRRVHLKKRKKSRKYRGKCPRF